jgi:hypothetical protein
MLKIYRLRVSQELQGVKSRSVTYRTSKYIKYVDSSNSKERADFEEEEGAACLNVSEYFQTR